MSEFGRIATVLSMVLGLGVTRLLLGIVTVFRIRHQSAVDWVPLAWACVLFSGQLEYWWAINQLPSVMPTFTFLNFIFLVLLTLMLFLSAALLLPSRNEDESGGMRLYFEKDGRYALLAYAGFLLLGAVANIVFFEAPPLAAWALLDIVMIVLPVVTFAVKSRSVYAALTLAYLPLAALDTWLSLTS